MNDTTLMRWTMVVATVLAASAIKDLWAHQASDVTVVTGLIALVLVFKRGARA